MTRTGTGLRRLLGKAGGMERAEAEARTPAVLPLTISVLVPTYRRPEDLRRCLAALAAQRRPPEEILIVLREEDRESRGLLASTPTLPGGVRLITTTAGGVVAALNAGLAAAKGEIIAITDDDAAPHPDWLQRLEGYYLGDPSVGGVGGRDWLQGARPEPERTRVGLVQWWGRVIGNHHLGVGPARDVDVLKGVNMSLRRATVAGRGFSTDLRGAGAQVHWELDCSLALRRAGWRLIYDPAIGVDHFLGPRFDYDQRDRFNALAQRDAVHNETLSLLSHFSAPRRFVFLSWAVLIGTQGAPGLAQWIRFLFKGVDRSGARLLASLRGRVDGWQTWRAGRRRAHWKAAVQPAELKG